MRFIPDALAVPHFSRPRQPASGSELSLMVCRNMSPSTTTGNFPVAFTQCFTGDSGLRPEGNVSAFPSSSHSDPGEGVFSRLDYGSLALRPVALLALLSEQTGSLQPSRAFTSGLSTVWSPAPPPGITTVPTGQSARAGLSPARSSTSFTALPRPPSPLGEGWGHRCAHPGINCPLPGERVSRYIGAGQGSCPRVAVE